jgi:hypothetical protein
MTAALAVIDDLPDEDARHSAETLDSSSPSSARA